MTAQEFKNRLDRGVLFGDGAMGTMLYSRGVFINSCFEELVLSRPDKVRAIHQAYVDVGVDFIESNSFGANALKLGKFGLVHEVDRINVTAAELARQSAGDSVLVAGAVGPTGAHVFDNDKIIGEAEKLFRQQINSLVKGGIDFILLETFYNSQELLVAVNAAADICDLAVVAQIAIDPAVQAEQDDALAQAISRLAGHPSVTAVGFNCSVGPADMFDALKRIEGITDKPLSVQPNAGFPQSVDGRKIYMCTPEYMAEYAKRFYRHGARIIGGCCGTTPEHLHEMIRAVRCFDQPAQRVRVSDKQRQVKAKPPKTPPVPLQERSAFGRKLHSGECIRCLEITPPRGVDLDSLLHKVKSCHEAGIDAVNIPDGPRASLRLSAMVTAEQIQNRVEIEPILHVCCRDRNILGLQSDILGMHVLGLRNLLLVTGDPPKCGDYPQAAGVFDLDSIALTQLVADLNSGIDVAGNRLDPPLRFTIGIGVNPAATDLDAEIGRLSRKIKSGAEYAISQPVFDIAAMHGFLDRIDSFGIPVLAGIWLFTSYKNAEFMANEVPGVVVPEAILQRMKKTNDREESLNEGIAIAVEMVRELRNRVAGFVVSAPFGRVEAALTVLKGAVAGKGKHE
jgi:methionine synthase / methylenetetrahydrofolate reductase(NADPH)